MDFKDLDLKTVGREVLLAGGVWSSDGKVYVCLFPELGVLEEYDLNVLHMTADDWKLLIRQSDLMETEVLEKAADGKLTKVVARKCQRQIEQSVSWNVFRRDGYACRYCGNDKVPLTVDHLVLWEEGGPSIEENLVAACRRCNKVRGNTQYADWLKHPSYWKVATRGLTSAQQRANYVLADTLDGIPRFVTKRKKR